MEFTATPTEQNVVFKIEIEGKLHRGGGVGDQTYLQLLGQAKKAAKNKLVIFDLRKLKFWDTRGIESVINTVIEINKISPLRAGIFAPQKETKNFSVAQRMYPTVGTKSIPWCDTEEELMRFLQVLAADQR